MRYKLIFAVFMFTAVFLPTCKERPAENHDQHTTTENQSADTLKKSVPKEVHTYVGPAHISLKYHAPSVRGRTIWGGLVPYGEVWVTGAHSATSFETDKELELAGKTISPGKYALFTIPDKEKWTFIVNNNWDQHLADEYDAKDDIVRTDVVPVLDQPLQERLKYTVADKGNNGGSIMIRWEKVSVEIPFVVKAN